jgi:mannose-6-phosphate isomerase-like protein (cupin superfamily)
MSKFEKDDILTRLISSEANFCASPKKAQNSPARACDHWPRPVLLERAAYLRKLARFSEGSATDTLCKSDANRIQLSVLLRSAPPVLHEDFAVILLVVEGRATLVSGGSLLGATRTRRRELTGTAIDGGRSRELRPGEVAHISAGTPYQILLAGEAGFTCLVLKIKETPGQ